jgi:hypothetical protein
VSYRNHLHAGACRTLSMRTLLASCEMQNHGIIMTDSSPFQILRATIFVLQIIYTRALTLEAHKWLTPFRRSPFRPLGPSFAVIVADFSPLPEQIVDHSLLCFASFQLFSCDLLHERCLVHHSRFRHSSQYVSCRSGPRPLEPIEAVTRTTVGTASDVVKYRLYETRLREYRRPWSELCWSRGGERIE